MQTPQLYSRYDNRSEPGTRKHRIYVRWKRLLRSGVPIVDEWRDFHVFQAAVGDAPGPNMSLVQLDQGAPMGPANWGWDAFRRRERLISIALRDMKPGMNIQTPATGLRPLPMRITQQQYERLTAARGRDGLSVQEHIRRSLDQYLGKLEREATRLAALPVVSSDGVPSQAAADPATSEPEPEEEAVAPIAPPPGVHPRAPARSRPARLRSR